MPYPGPTPCRCAQYKRDNGYLSSRAKDRCSANYQKNIDQAEDYFRNKNVDATQEVRAARRAEDDQRLEEAKARVYEIDREWDHVLQEIDDAYFEHCDTR